MKKNCLIFLFSCLFSITNGQNKTVNTQKIDSLLILKKEMINDYEIKSFYTIQLYSGERRNAVEAKNEYDKKGYDFKSIIEYETPNYKLWVGRFRTKLYADKAFAEIKDDYPSALIFRPGRQYDTF